MPITRARWICTPSIKGAVVEDLRGSIASKRIETTVGQVYCLTAMPDKVSFINDLVDEKGAA